MTLAVKSKMSWSRYWLLLVAIPGGASATPYFTNSSMLQPTSLLSSSQAPTASNAVGSYILDGLGQTTNSPTSSSPDSTSSTAVWSSAVIKPVTENPMLPIKWSSSMPEVEKCWTDIVNWRSSSVSYWNAHAAGQTVASTLTSTFSYIVVTSTTLTTLYPSIVSTYTLCDHSPRADVLPVTKTLANSTTLTNTYTFIARTSELPDYTVPQPCTPDATTCRMWYFHSNIQDVNEDELLAQCGYPTSTNETCVIQGGPVELIYWPVAPKADLCENNGTIFQSLMAGDGRNETGVKAPETVTTLGRTFTSGTVYLSFSTLYAEYDGFWDRTGPTYSDLIVPLPSSAISTQCGGRRSARGSGTMLNYADLNWPVPASAYSCQARCDPVGMPICPGCSFTAVPSTGACGTIWSDINPNLAVPTQIREMVPEWSTCLLWNNRIPNFYFDPPIPLQAQSVMAGVTTAVAQPTVEPAAPSSSMASTMPVETGTSGSLERASSTPGLPSGPSGGTSAVQPVSFTSVADPAMSGDPAQTSGPPVSVGATSAEGPDGAKGSVEQSSQVGLPSVAPVPSSALISFAVSVTKTQGDPSGMSPVLPTTNGASHAAGEVQTTASLNALSVLQSALSTHESAGQADHSSASTNPDGKSGASTIWTSPSAAQSDVGSGQISDTAQPSYLGSSIIATSTAYVVDGPTLSVGGPVATVSSQIASALSGGVIVSAPAPTRTEIPGPDVAASQQSQPAFTDPTVTMSSSATAVPSVFALGSLTLTASHLPNNPAAIIIESQTLTKGGPAATINNHTISQASSGLYLVDSSTIQLLTPAAILPVIVESSPTVHPLTMAAAGLTLIVTPISSDPGAFAVKGTTLYPGSDAITISSQIVSAGSAGLVLLGAAPSTPVSAVLAAGSLTVTAISDQQGVSVDGTTLSAGGAALTLSAGETVSAGSSGLVMVQSNSIMAFTSAMSSSGSETTAVEKPTVDPARGSAPPMASPSSTPNASLGAAGTRVRAWLVYGAALLIGIAAAVGR